MVKEYKWCAIDAEGDVGKHGLLGVAFYSDTDSCYITNHTDIRNTLLQYAERGYTFIAHNAEYDMSVIFWQLNIPMRAVYFNGRFNRGEWRYNGKRTMVQLWDTMALSGGMSLQSLAKSMGISKLETPAALTNEDRSRYAWKCDIHDIWECIECYAVRDAEICYRFMQDLTVTLHAWGIDPHRRLSGLASHVWRRLDTPENPTIKDRRIKQLARRGYHGGRTEPFKYGTIPAVYTGDVTSMYPAMMKQTPMPDPQHTHYHENVKPDRWILNGEGVADVDITVPNMYVPPLPYYNDGKMKYPVGRLSGVYTLLELRYALSLGCEITRIRSAAYSMHRIYPFNNFIDTLWSMREAYIRDKDPRALFAKLLMNNLYGYLGMKSEMIRADEGLAAPGIPLKKQPKSTWYTRGNQLFLTYERVQPTDDTWTNVMWAAQITAAARIYLHKLMLLQGQSLIYCDTDSIFSQSPIIGMGEGLGALKPDGNYQQAIIIAPKLYALQAYESDMPESWLTEQCKSHGVKQCGQCLWRPRAKGVARDAALTFLRDGVASFSLPIKPRSQARRGIQAGTWVEVTKHHRDRIAKRQPLQPDVLIGGTGWSDSVPLVVTFDP